MSEEYRRRMTAVFFRLKDEISSTEVDFKEIEDVLNWGLRITKEALGGK